MTAGNKNIALKNTVHISWVKWKEKICIHGKSLTLSF